MFRTCANLTAREGVNFLLRIGIDRCPATISNDRDMLIEFLECCWRSNIEKTMLPSLQALSEVFDDRFCRWWSCNHDETTPTLDSWRKIEPIVWSVCDSSEVVMLLQRADLSHSLPKITEVIANPGIAGKALAWMPKAAIHHNISYQLEAVARDILKEKRINRETVSRYVNFVGDKYMAVGEQYISDRYGVRGVFMKVAMSYEVTGSDEVLIY